MVSGVETGARFAN